MRSLSSRFAVGLLGSLLILSACVPVRREPPVSRVVRPERIEVEGGRFGSILPVPNSMLGTVDYDLPLVANTWVASEMSFLLTDRRETMERWMERSDFYQAFVEAVFSEYGIPRDLLHIGMIESGYIPTAQSRAGAVGIWQFMPATSGDVDLRVDDLVDERMDPVRSTRAAALYLRMLYRIHGDWALAAAAYNAGTGRISRSMNAFGVSNFWDLASRGDLATETRHYVPRLYATTIISRDRERFGFAPARSTATFAFDSIHVDRSVTLGELGEMTGVDGVSLSTLNPHLRRGLTPSGGYWVWVPAGAGERAQRAYTAASVAVPPASRSVALASVARTGASDSGNSILYTVRPGDTLSEIARDFEVSVAEIQQANSLNGTLIRSGQRLTIPVSSAAADQPVEHLVVAGDTLWDLARQYGSSIEAIEEANGLGARPIIPGQRLEIPVTPQ